MRAGQTDHNRDRLVVDWLMRPNGKQRAVTHTHSRVRTQCGRMDDTCSLHAGSGLHRAFSVTDSSISWHPGKSVCVNRAQCLLSLAVSVTNEVLQTGVKWSSQMLHHDTSTPLVVTMRHQYSWVFTFSVLLWVHLSLPGSFTAILPGAELWACNPSSHSGGTLL